MRKVKATEMKSFIGKKVRIVYPSKDLSPPDSLTQIYGSDITPEVTLKEFDLDSMKATFVRANGDEDTKIPVLVLTNEEETSN